MIEREVWVVVTGWEKFQHYKDRQPPWIKLYTELLDDPDYLALTAEQRSLLVGIWMLYAKSHGAIRNDTRYLSRKLAQRVTRHQLDRLNHAGFLTFSASKSLASSASSPLASRAPARSREAEAEAEEREQPTKVALSNTPDTPPEQAQARPDEEDFEGLEPEAELAKVGNGRVHTEAGMRPDRKGVVGPALKAKYSPGRGDTYVANALIHVPAGERADDLLYQFPDIPASELHRLQDAAAELERAASPN